MSANTVFVKNIASATSDKEIQDFFSFCGKITDIKVTTEGTSKAATVTFEKDTAAKTALLLNNTQLGPSHISVTGTAKPDEPSSSADAAAATTPAAGGPAAAAAAPGEHQHLTQEEKPRARIFAEYLAHGYVIGDAALERAIDLDHKHNVSTRFVDTLQKLDTKYHVNDRAKTADQSYGITKGANSLLTGLSSYFEKASNTPTGKRVVDFYTVKQRQVKDIHAEARRLAEIKKQEHGGSAYKAAGLDRVFGAEKTAAPTAAPGAAAPGVAAPGTTTAAPPPTTSAPPAAAPASAAPAATATTGTPKFDAPPTAPF